MPPRYVSPSAKSPPEPPRRSRAKRVALWSIFTLCGMFMGVILLSQPKVVELIQLKAEYVSARFQDEAREPALVLNMSGDGEATTSSVRSNAALRMAEKTRWFMPRDAVPVRRSGFLNKK